MAVVTSVRGKSFTGRRLEYFPPDGPIAAAQIPGEEPSEMVSKARVIFPVVASRILAPTSGEL
jgi:hypothetical protein